MLFIAARLRINVIEGLVGVVGGAVEEAERL
jgi:hypothetical protein